MSENLKRHAMRKSPTNPVRRALASRRREQGNVRIVVLGLVLFLLGLAAGGLWFQRADKEPGVPADGQPSPALSPATRAVLQRLDSPVEIRFYSLLDQTSVPDAMQAFARRMDQLLAEYEREAGGKLKVKRYNSPTDANVEAAEADGLRAFNLDQGEASFLGLAVAQAQQKESLPRLVPEWEPAVEYDLSRAIARVSSAKSAAPTVASSKAAAAAAEEVRRIVPDPGSVSVEEGARILREAALNDFRAAAKKMEVQVREAQERLVQAQSGKSDAEQQAAMKHLQQLQLQQADNLKEIAARLEAQIEALKRIQEP